MSQRLVGLDPLAAGAAPIPAPRPAPVRFRLGLTIGGVLETSALPEAQALVASILDAIQQGAPELHALEVQTTLSQLPTQG